MVVVRHIEFPSISALVGTWILLLWFNAASAQQKTATDTILLGAVIEGRDTIPMVFMDDVDVIDKLPKRWVRRQTEYNRLRYNIYKTYPYAVIAAGVLKDVYAYMEHIPDEKAKKQYMKSVEKDLKAKFKGELENMTISQGQVLVKLINRQTGRNCYSIIKEVKGGFNAVIYQSVALLFNNNLKKAYDPTGDDKDMEQIVRELEATNYYRYQQYQQQQQSQTTHN
ncbi:MAG: DUF4294 domain-containing protein [Bacteroidetes bacterium]|nr:DUF4294 domain-containing protein [Bacteroidota bacterium]MBS1740166.1 DUF4294 domain-containing protein [Bacteroidota bacterium]